MGYLVLLSILAALTIWGCWIAVTEGCYESIKGPLEAGSYFEVLRTAFVCNPWVAWVAVNAAFHWSWVTTLAVCQSYQIAILGMTTNERMNAGRYSHFRHHGHGGHSHASPFSRGCWQNSVDFLGWTCRGCRLQRRRKLGKINSARWQQQWNRLEVKCTKLSIPLLLNRFCSASLLYRTTV